ncbi:MAG: M23 family metallopeptidase, partial [Anaerolineaceae bacterium]
MNHTPNPSESDRSRPSLRTAVILILLPGLLALLMFVLVPYLRGMRDQQKMELLLTQTAAADIVAAEAGLAAETAIPERVTPTAMPQASETRTPEAAPSQAVTATAAVVMPALCSPVDGVEIAELDQIISQEYSVPNQKSDLGHHGVDLGSYNFKGRYLFEIPIRAILSGKVAGITVNRPPIGNVVILETHYEDLPPFLRDLYQIQPGQSLYHFYGHLVNEPVQQIGDVILCGEQINLLGKSRTVEAHLHLETRIGATGLVIDQMAFYDAATTEEERAEYLWWRTSGDLTAVNPMDIF